jgi:hypothetical protein
MVAAASVRPRATPSPPTPVINRRRSIPIAKLALFAIPAFLAATFIWQIASPMLRTEVAIREAVSVGRVSLEADPAGSRIDFVLVDRVGQQTTADGTVSVTLREPDGTLWQTTRSVSAGDFQPLPEGGLLAGRLGYAVVIPASDWARAPRRGGAASVTVSVVPSGDGPTFSTVAEERFP